MNRQAIKETAFNCLAWSATLLALVFWLVLMAVFTMAGTKSLTALVIPVLGLGTFLKTLIGSRNDKESKFVFKLAVSIIISIFAMCMGYLLKLAIDGALPH